MYPQIWLFGRINTLTKNIVLAPVEKRNRERLIPIIQRHVLAGTTIVSDCWRAYDTLGKLGYTHLKVNHSQNFVDPTTGANTNNIECLWSKVKCRNKVECGTSRKLVRTYLIEFQCRRKYSSDPFRSIVEHIRHVYPLRYYLFIFKIEM